MKIIRWMQQKWWICKFITKHFSVYGLQLAKFNFLSFKARFCYRYITMNFTMEIISTAQNLGMKQCSCLWKVFSTNFTENETSLGYNRYMYVHCWLMTCKHEHKWDDYLYLCQTSLCNTVTNCMCLIWNHFPYCKFFCLQKTWPNQNLICIITNKLEFKLTCWIF